jgi:predicted component of type VI protein secretion system
MKNTLIVLAICLIAVVLLAGCKEGGSSASSSLDSTFDAAKIDFDVIGNSSDNPNIPGHMPEPATVTLLGSGLLAYALFRKKRKS